MPELNWYWGYPLNLAVMLAIAIVLYAYFWKKGWLKNTSQENQAGKRKSS